MTGQPEPGSILYIVNQTIGTFNVSLVVSDGEDESIPVYTTIIVTNAPPVANAGADLQVIGTSTVILDGRGSLDKDGDIVSYEWTQIGGDRNVGIKNKNAAMASFRAPNPKEPITYTLYFELQVTDNDGAIGTDQVTVYIYPDP